MNYPSLVGKKVKCVREMTPKELSEQYWEVDRCNGAPLVIEFEGGVKVFPSRDPEGNGGGCLFGRKGKNDFYVIAE